MTSGSPSINDYYCQRKRVFVGQASKRPSSHLNSMNGAPDKSRSNKFMRRNCNNNNDDLIEITEGDNDENIENGADDCEGTSSGCGSLSPRSARRLSSEMDDSLNSVEGEATSKLDKIYFIKSTRPSEVWTEAYKSLSRATFKPCKIEPDDIDDLINRQQGVRPILIMDSFEGPLFERLRKEKRIRLLTAFALLHCNPKRMSMIPDRGNPIASLCMKYCKVTFSSMPERDIWVAVRQKVKLMCGVFTIDIRKATTHVIAPHWNSEKCLFFRSLGKPVMSPEWVDRCWEKREDISDVNDPSLAKYKLQPFVGMNICCSGFGDKERPKIKTLVYGNGGNFTGSLYVTKKTEKPANDSDVNLTTTHLIAKEKTGEKYSCAMKHEQIHIVTIDWLTHSVSMGYPLIEAKYSLRDPTEKSKTQRQKSSRRKEKTQASRDAVAENVPTTVIERCPSSQSSSTEDVNTQMEKILAGMETKDKLFDGLSFYFCGVTSSYQSNAKKIITKCGGSVYTDLVSAVTHAILGPHLTQKEALAVNRHEEKVRAVSKVSLIWVLECVENNVLIEEYFDPSLAKLLEVKSTQDLTAEERKKIARQRALKQSDVMKKKLLEIPLNENRNSEEPKAPDRRGFKLGAISCSPVKMKIPEIVQVENMVASIPVAWGSEGARKDQERT